MSSSLWRSDAPQPEDLDVALAGMDGWVIEDRAGGQKVRTHITVDLVGEDAERLGRISAERGEEPRGVLSELLRAADRSVA
jgi:hypothetical protein